MFVTFVRGMDRISPEDRGNLWEHFVLDTLKSIKSQQIFYWRDKTKKEIDFVVKNSSGSVDTYECKINPDGFNPKNLQVFRKIYPEGHNFIVEFTSLKHIMEAAENY